MTDSDRCVDSDDFKTFNLHFYATEHGSFIVLDGHCKQWGGKTTWCPMADPTCARSNAQLDRPAANSLEECFSKCDAVSVMVEATCTAIAWGRGKQLKDPHCTTFEGACHDSTYDENYGYNWAKRSYTALSSRCDAKHDKTIT